MERLQKLIQMGLSLINKRKKENIFISNEHFNLNYNYIILF